MDRRRLSAVALLVAMVVLSSCSGTAPPRTSSTQTVGQLATGPSAEPAVLAATAEPTAVPTAIPTPAATPRPTPVPSPLPTPRPSPGATGPIVALGDSLTYGFGVTTAIYGPPPSQSYPADMARDLGIPVVNAGISGTTAQEVLDPASEPEIRPIALQLPALLALHPRLVVVEFGTNEADLAWPISKSASDLQQLVGRIAAAHVPVVIVGTHVDCTVQPCLPPPPGLPAQTYTTAWDAALTALAAESHAGLVLDVEHGFTAADLADWIHCDAQGYRLMADRIETAVRVSLA